jgi:phosphoribosylaminoimidazole (AIR) synthetase
MVFLLVTGYKTQNVDAEESPNSVSPLSRHVSKTRDLTVRGANETANFGELMKCPTTIFDD